jgi:hypothetical protein
MRRNDPHRGMFTSSPARRVGWLCLIAALACGLLYPASAQNTNRAPGAQTAPNKRRPKVKQNGAQGLPDLTKGTLKGRVNCYLYEIDNRVGGSGKQWLRRKPVYCGGEIVFEIAGRTFTLDSPGFYSFKDLLPGNHKLYVRSVTWGAGTFIKQYTLATLLQCAPQPNPRCDRVNAKEVTIQGGTTTILNVDVVYASTYL